MSLIMIQGVVKLLAIKARNFVISVPFDLVNAEM